jgi:hypothetical protein
VTAEVTPRFPFRGISSGRPRGTSSTDEYLNIDRAEKLIQIQPVLAYPKVSTLKDDAIGGDIHCFNELGAYKFQGALRRSVLGVTGDPETREA